MTTLILIIGTLILLMGVLILIKPEAILGYLGSNHEALSIHALAVIVRLILGVLLISQAGMSTYPITIEILGWLSIIAALSFAAMGRKRFIGFISWALRVTKPFGRIGGVFAAAFGGFLIYAFV